MNALSKMIICTRDILGEVIALAYNGCLKAMGERERKINCTPPPLISITG